MKNNKYVPAKYLLFSLCFFCFFLFSSLAIAAQSSATGHRQRPDLTITTDAMTTVQANDADYALKDTRKTEILAKALRISLGSDFKAYFTVEPPRGIEAVREELRSKTIYRAVFGLNIPL